MENHQTHQGQKQTMTKASPTRNFMSPTISATSKALTPRRKILGERNSSDPHIPKSQNHSSVDDSVESLVSSTDSVNLSSHPYDPVRNYLSPRPEFLRYKPNRIRSRAKLTGSIDSEKMVNEPVHVSASWCASVEEKKEERENEEMEVCESVVNEASVLTSLEERDEVEDIQAGSFSLSSVVSEAFADAGTVLSSPEASHGEVAEKIKHEERETGGPHQLDEEEIEVGKKRFWSFKGVLKCLFIVAIIFLGSSYFNEVERGERNGEEGEIGSLLGSSYLNEVERDGERFDEVGNGEEGEIGSLLELKFEEGEQDLEREDDGRGSDTELTQQKSEDSEDKFIVSSTEEEHQCPIRPIGEVFEDGFMMMSAVSSEIEPNQEKGEVFEDGYMMMSIGEEHQLEDAGYEHGFMISNEEYVVEEVMEVSRVLLNDDLGERMWEEFSFLGWNSSIGEDSVCSNNACLYETAVYEERDEKRIIMDVADWVNNYPIHGILLGIFAFLVILLPILVKFCFRNPKKVRAKKVNLVTPKKKELDSKPTVKNYPIHSKPTVELLSEFSIAERKMSPRPAIQLLGELTIQEKNQKNRVTDECESEVSVSKENSSRRRRARNRSSTTRAQKSLSTSEFSTTDSSSRGSFVSHEPIGMNKETNGDGKLVVTTPVRRSSRLRRNQVVLS